MSARRIGGRIGLGLLALLLQMGGAAQARDVAPERLRALLSGALPAGAEELRAMEEHFSALARRLAPAVVAIQVLGSEGSGVIVRGDGLVLTAGHVSVRPGVRALVTLSDGRRVRGVTLGRDHELDSGMVRIETPAPEGGWPHAALAPAPALERGAWCLAFGHPGGYLRGRPAPLRLGRALRIARRAIISDCALVGGDSGGPLFDTEGRVAGIHSRITRSLAGNFHVPIAAFHNAWERLLAGEVWGAPAFLGVFRGEDESPPAVGDLVRGGPAQRAGIRRGDVILGIADQTVRTFDDVRRLIGARKPGEEVTVTVRRDERELRISVTLGAREEP